MSHPALATRDVGHAARATSAIAFRNVSKQFQGVRGDAVTAVRDISLEIESGTFNCIIGPSGCGKSTLLNMTAGLMAPTSGDVIYDGSPVVGPNQRVGYLTQQSHLLPWRTVESNVGLALEIRGVHKDKRRRLVREMLERVGLADVGERYPSQLSGGMQRRVSIARTLIYEPETLLMDEPFGALDAQLRLVLQRQLLGLWERDKKTVLFVTHDLEEAMCLGDNIIVFSPSPGHILHIEKVEFPRPRDPVALRGTAEFASAWARLWRLLEPQIAGSLQ